MFYSKGNDFYIQIFGTSSQISYELILFKRMFRTEHLLLYKYRYKVDKSLTTPYQLDIPITAFRKISKALNSIFNMHESNQFTQILFQRFVPYHPKTISRKKNLSLNPCINLYDIFKQYGGYFIYVKGNRPFIFKVDSNKMFAWCIHFINNI